MNNEINYKNNPLNGVSLKIMLHELVSHYGFDILFAYLNINCFKTNPGIESSIKFLKKTQWAREKVEIFYLYNYKNLPRVSSEQFETPPRDRIIPEGQTPGEPAELSLEDAKVLQEKRARKTAERGQDFRRQRRPENKTGARKKNHYSSNRNNEHTDNNDKKSSGSSIQSVFGDEDPWANWKK